MSLELQLPDSAAMESLGQRLADCLESAIVFLQGELGAGKTTLARGILRGLGYAGKVRSPTYSLVEPYSLDSGPVYHLDLYRLADPEELEWLGLRDMLSADALLLIEWPERGAGQLPAADLDIRLAIHGQGRTAHLVAVSPRGQQILHCLKAN